MPLVIGVPKETVPGERRVAVVPDVVRKLQSRGADVCVERGAGDGSYFHDADFSTACVVEDAAEVFARSQIIFKVQAPTLDEVRAMRPGTVLIGFL